MAPLAPPVPPPLPLIPVEDLSLRVLELEQVLAGEEERDEELDWAMNPRRQSNVLNVEEYNNPEIRRCYLCQSPGHIQKITVKQSN